uniref:Calmodulin-interacting protein 111 n=1 Tax=Anthurium amnicola TaxID=1678845 RepID=A0A1D1Y622_9ARAE
MPSSKGKKPSKTRSSLSALDSSPSTRRVSTPSPVPRGAGASEEGEDEELTLRRLSEAAAKFPSLISEYSFRGRITDVDSSWEQGGGRASVWLSEAAMVSSSLRPGTLVSVSLPASGKQLSDGIPLDALSDGCCKYFGLDVDGIMTREAGRYFAIAKVFSSQKVFKNGVKLSWSLSCTMGFPPIGRMLFVFPIGYPPASHLLCGVDEMHKSTGRTVSFASLCLCTDLHLKLVPLNIGQMPYTERLTAVSDSVNSGCILSGEASSPKTPSCYQSKLSSPVSGPIHVKGTQDYIPNTGCYSNINQSAVREAMKDDKCSELLRTYAVRWFHGHYVLNGNLLALPIFGQLSILHVESGIKASVGSAREDQTYDTTNNLVVSETESQSLLQVDTIFFVDSRTKVHLNPMPSVAESSDKKDTVSSKLMLKDFMVKEAGNHLRLGGLSREYALLKEIISFSFSAESVLPRYKGVLLHGPPGTGKTSLACSCAHDAGANLYVVNGPEIVSEYYGESELKLVEVFDSARGATPAVVFIDELDAIAPARKGGGEGLSLRIVATLLELMDGISRSDGVLVIAATNRLDSVDPALRRPGRFDREIEIGVPTPDQRLDILSGILNEMQHSISDKEIQSLALATHGFVGADLSALCNEAAMIALRRYIKNKSLRGLTLDKCCGEPCPRLNGQIAESRCYYSGDDNTSYVDHMDSLLSSLSKMSVSLKPFADHALLWENTITDQRGAHGSACVVEESTELEVTAADFEQAKLKIRPSAMREVMLEVPKVCWEDVGGQNEVKRQLIEAIQWPQTCPDAFKRIGIRPPRGLLMFGPPGCSKTLMARAVASEAKLNFLAVKGPELLSKWVGESEKAISLLFAKARANSPSIIFFDEIDGLATTRGQENDGTSVGDRVMSQLLIELNGLDQRFGVTVIAATNRPDKIDPALLRPGRFDRHLDVKPPNMSDREEIFSIHMRNMPVSADVTTRELASITEGYSGADIKLVCREAAIAALEECFDVPEISMVHFKIAIGRVQPADVQFYLDISEKFKRFVDTRTEN